MMEINEHKMLNRSTVVITIVTSNRGDLSIALQISHMMGYTSSPRDKSLSIMTPTVVKS